ncbi:MAG: superoxide dismutase [Pirellulales bacterium]
MTFNRREVLRAGVGVASWALADKLLVSSSAAAQAAGVFTLPKLPYAVDALEPHIDARTMEIHHDKHHQAYIDNLNKAVAEHPELRQKRAVTLLREIDQVPEAIRQAVINNGGGHVNHSLYWQMMAPNAGGEPSGDVAKEIDRAFGGFDQFKTQFSDAAMKRFGSGWAWLVVDRDGTVKVISTANQDSPFMAGQYPILGVDVWEHAYYLKYQNKRADYVQAWWNVVNWDYVNELHQQARG